MNSIVKVIKKELNDDLVLNKLIKTKGYLLSENDKWLLNTYFKYKNIKFKKEFINLFTIRLNNLKDDKLRYYLDNLKDIMSLSVELKISKGVIRNIDFNMPLETSKLQDKPSGYSKDFYFNSLIEKGNYDELFNLYGIDEIEKNSNLLKR